MPSKLLCLIVALALGAVPLAAQHRSGGSHGGGRSYHPRSYSSHPRSSIPHPRATTPRSKGGSAHPRSPSTGSPHPIHRSQAAKDDFMRRTGHPHGWPGHVVDHVVPLACGAADAPSNMQWQSTEEGKAKDKVERRGCRR